MESQRTDSCETDCKLHTDTFFFSLFQNYFEVFIFLYLNWLLKYFFFPYCTPSLFFLLLIPCRYLELAFMLCLSPTFPRLCKFSFLNKHFLSFLLSFFWSLSNSAKSFLYYGAQKSVKHSNTVSPILHWDKKLITCPPSADLIPLIILYMLNMVFAILQHITLYSSAEFMVCSEPVFFL